jgi:signal transduction histidine kinase
VVKRSAAPQRFSEGMFWFLIAAALLLSLLDARLSATGPTSLVAGWTGVFVVYYALRSWLVRSDQHLLRSCGQGNNHWRWLDWWRQVPFSLLLDLLVITVLMVLSGGWASPLYLLYLGWVVALIDVPSSVTCLWLAVLAGVAFIFGSLLAPYQPIAGQHLPWVRISWIGERVLLLLLLSLGIGGINAALERIGVLWEAEQRRWDGLRQVVFAHLAHELSTPLSAISVSTALLATAAGEPVSERRQDLLHVIDRNCARMNLLIDDLLALWRGHRQQLDFTPARLRCLEVAESVTQMLGPLLESKRQRLVVVAEPPDVDVFADVRRLEQVLVNLLANAQHYAPSGTSITLTIRRQQHEVLFAVHDDGAGVPLEEQGHLFDLFYQGRGANQAAAPHSAGIGLALAKALVALQGGHIWIESVSGKGSTFYFTLPAADLE